MDSAALRRLISSLNNIVLVVSILFITSCTTVGDSNLNKGLEAFEQGDYQTALKLWVPLAEQGHAVAQHNLGVIYEKGEGVRQDYTEAMKWYRKAAESEYAPSQINLGKMYGDGTGVGKDPWEARKWYLKAAEQGAAQAQYNLGIQSFNGEGVVQDYAEAERWFRKAARKGLAGAQYKLGHMYLEGHGVTQDYEDALSWYRLAAEQGYYKAQVLIGVMYANGQGVNQNNKIALKWLTAATAQGYAEPYYLRGKLYQEWQEYHDAISDMNTAITINPDYVEALNSLAWMQSTAKLHSYRNGKEAISNAKRAVSLTNREDAMILETLAAAYAEDGQYEKAEETMHEAISKLNPADNIQFGEEFEAILKSYELGQKYY